VTFSVRASFTLSSSGPATLPTSGLTASGTGFTAGNGASTTVTFTIASGTITQSATCYTNSAGSFTGCVLQINTAPYGSDVVTAKDSANVANSNSVTFSVGAGYVFTETGLPSGTAWSVTLGQSTMSTTGSSLEFLNVDPLVTYSWVVNGPFGYNPSPSHGDVSGGAATVSITFASTGLTFTATFTESGLASGTGWSVTIGSQTRGTTGTTISFVLATAGGVGGAYSYTVNPVPGYTITSAGPGTVSSGSPSVAVTFVDPPLAPAVGPLGGAVSPPVLDVRSGA
jgi:hypothetical protein